jgi:long-subunit acyl-CoA synthetase (AMP-forming)/predicted GNAT family acetyltransferase
MSGTGKQEIRELIEILSSKTPSFNKNSLESIFGCGQFHESELGKLIESSNIEDFVNLGSLLLQEYEKSEASLRQSYRELLFLFLDFARTSQLLKKLYAENTGNAWFELLLSIIKKANFTTGQLFRQRVKRYGNKTLFKVIKEQNIQEYSWNTVEKRVNEIGRGLFRLAPQGVLPGPVAILSENSLEVALIDLACLTTGVVNVLIPANSVPAQVEYILRHSGAKTLFVSNDNQLSKIANFRSQLANLQNIVYLSNSNTPKDDVVIPFDKFLKRGENIPLQRIQQAVEAVNLEDLATIMYTSGTTEAPKGIMFSHLNIVSKRFARAIALPEIGDHDTLLCYLPLFHTFGRWFEMMGSIFWGSIYAFMQNPSIETMIDNMQRVKPTVFISIPKKWMQLYEKIREKVDIEAAPKKQISDQVCQITGGDLKWGLSAAGYLDPDIFRFFQEYGIELLSGFGMTEATGGITMTPPFHYRDNSVGKALPGIEICLAEDGEMSVRGPYVMKGYLHSETTNLRDGWFFTGDIFSQDQDGYYYILDRKKEIYKNVKGETIAPQKIENLFRDFESVKHVFLVGDHKEYNTLLLYPNYEYDQIDLSRLGHDKLREFFNSLIVSVNRFLPPFERIVNFAIIDRDFDAAKGELTPKGTFKRKAVEKNFREVIERMYQKDYAAYKVDDFEIRIPNWLLREKGLTADDLMVENSSIVLKPTKAALRVKTSRNKPGQVLIGTFWYIIPYKHLNLGQLIDNPALWMGNIELQYFLGEDIFRWTRMTESQRAEVKVVQPPKLSKISSDILAQFNQMLNRSEKNIQGIHLSAFILQGLEEKSALNAVQYLESILSDENEALATLAKLILMRTAKTKNFIVTRRAFQALILNVEGDAIKSSLKEFLDANPDILDQKTIAMFCEKDFSKNQINAIFSLLKDYSERCFWQKGKTPKKSVSAILDLLTSYGMMHPVWYKSIRSELYKWSVFELDKEVRNHAKGQIEKLVSSFRMWLGMNQRIAVEPETSIEYRWDDVITFEEGINADDKEKIFNAIKNFPLIREAVFLFTEATLVRLQDICQQGIRISFLGSLHGKSVYRASVQTRYFGSFDLAINVNKTLSAEEVSSEITWLICAGAAQDQEPLVEEFWGYWTEYDLWTEEFIPGETVAKFLKRLDRHPEKEWIERMQLLWPYMVWSGLSAYIDFWSKTGRHLEIADPTPDNVIVPSHDYHVGSRIVSISHRKPFTSVSDMILSFRRYFIVQTETKYEKLKGYCSWHVIFSSFLEIIGETEGIRLLEQTLNSFQTDQSDNENSDLRQKLTAFIHAVQTKGFLPKRLHFAIQRYRRWLELNPEATPQARMQTLQELYTTYTIDKLKHDYPAARIQLFRDTVFAQSNEKLIKALDQLLPIIKERELTEDKLLNKISELKGGLKLNPNEEFYLARMTYPHLEPGDTVELISLPAEGTEKTELVVFIEDDDGDLLSIRRPSTPKEIARLHRLFTQANLPVEFLPEHQFLVILDDRLQVIGGLFYRRVDAQTVHFEKIVVAERHRKKGVSDGLMREFFNRLRSQNVRIVTVGFLRPEYFYKFGFRIENHYGGLVKKLEPKRRQELGAEIADMI